MVHGQSLSLDAIRRGAGKGKTLKTIIHVNRHVIAQNDKGGVSAPPLTVKTYKDNRKCSTAQIKDETGRIVAEIVYRPDKPLPCGARVWIETDLEVNCL